MQYWVFRQTRKKNRARLFAELLHGRLRQGWAPTGDLDLRQPPDKWARRLRRTWSHSQKEALNIYRKIAGALQIEDGDVVVVPNQPDDASFVLCRARSASKTTSPYRFGAPINGDFRHVVRIDPASIREYRYESRDVPAVVREKLRSRAYGSPVKAVRRPELIRKLALLGASRRSRREAAGTARQLGTLPNGTHWGPARLRASRGEAGFRPKNADDYLAWIKASVQRRSRLHEHVVRVAGEWLDERGADVETPHPIDLRMTKPRHVIFEVKVLGARNSFLPLRAAVGQLLEYRALLGPTDAELGVIFSENPGAAAGRYIEEHLGFLVCWIEGDRLHGGPGTAKRLRPFIARMKSDGRP